MRPTERHIGGSSDAGTPLRCDNWVQSPDAPLRVALLHSVQPVPSTTPAFLRTLASFARFIGDFRNATLHCACSSARMSRASVTASFPAMNSRARNGESSASSTENFRFHGQTAWEECRYIPV